MNAVLPVSIRSRLLLLTLMWLLPALAAGLWLVNTTVQAQRLANEEQLRETSRMLSLVVERELAQRATVARLLAGSPALAGSGEPTALSLGAFERQARDAMVGMGGWVELYRGDKLLLSTLAAGAAAVHPPARATLDASARVAAAASAGAGSGAISPLGTVHPLRQGADGGWSAAVVVPVPSAGGLPRAEVVVTVRADEFQRLIDVQRLPPEWLTTIVDSRYQVVARLPNPRAYTGRVASPDLIGHVARQAESAFESTSLDGVLVVGHYSTSAQGWTLIAAMPKQRFGGYLDAAVVQVAVLGALLLTLALTGAAYVSRGITACITKLRALAQSAKAGAVPSWQDTGLAECDAVGHALAEAAASARSARSELEARVEAAVQRTRLAEQQVSQNRRVEALGRLTGGVAHDFNNLLGVVSNSAQLIRRQTAEQPALQAPLAATMRAVELGARLTQQLMRFAGQQPLRPQALIAQRLLPEMRELLASVLGRRIELVITVEAGTASFTADSSELELALLNLALNARDGIGSQPGRLLLEARNAMPSEVDGLPPGPCVRIAMTDNGSGVEGAVAEHVFEPFFSTKPVGKGTGLGLSQVHGFCAQSGGIVTLTSQPGIATTVAMWLPASTRPGGGPSGETPAQDDIAGEPLFEVRILLVEDNVDLAEVTASLLQTAGAAVLRANSAEQALAAARAQRFDVVLSDIVMPGPMDGVALARALRKRWPGLPVVLISGYSSRMPPPGEFVVLHKPSTHDVLVRALLEAMRRGG